MAIIGMRTDMTRTEIIKLASLKVQLLALLMALFLPDMVAATAFAATPPKSIAVLPFEIEDNSGEIGPPDRHAIMLEKLTEGVAKGITAAKLYDVVPGNAVSQAVAAQNSGTFLRNCNGCELEIGKKAGADRVLIGWVFKMSTLIGTLHIAIKDVATGNVVYTHAFDFRGDDQRAWDRASKYFVEDLGYAR